MTDALSDTPADPLGAFLPGPRLTLDGRAGGPLDGVAVAVKDLYDIAGTVTGCGNPDWAATHGPASDTAPAVQRLLDAGARIVGKTITDELAFSLNGENAWYGTPVNPAAPDRIPGGSSSGSASAVAGGAADAALGSDTGGSVRAPASFCGIYGIRTSHGAIPLEGIMPLAAGFDTIGWFARDPVLLRRIGDVLLDRQAAPDGAPVRLLYAEDAFALADPTARPGLDDAARRVEAVLGPAERVTIAPEGLAAWLPHFQALQWREIWTTHGAWIRSAKPRFDPIIAARFEGASRVSDEAVAAATAFREDVVRRMAALLEGGAVLLMPTVPHVAPLKGLPPDQVVSFRNRALALLCVSGLARLPQISLPMVRLADGPVGLSLVGAAGSDRRLLALAERVPAGG